MPSVHKRDYTYDRIVSDDGSVAFKCNDDVDAWPWMHLPASHPIVVQSVNYWASVEASTARGTFDPTKWSALKEMDWQLGDSAEGHAAGGVMTAPGDEDAMGYSLRLHDSEGRALYTLRGTGVVFRTRDFETWRSTDKTKIIKAEAREALDYAPLSHLGVATEVEAFLAPISAGHRPSTTGLITQTAGFYPGHPHIEGSGDHVNATHLGEVARQFASLLVSGTPIMVTGGHMRFDRYIELGVPFSVTSTEQDNGHTSMAVEQAGRLCAALSIKYKPL